MTTTPDDTLAVPVAPTSAAVATVVNQININVAEHAKVAALAAKKTVSPLKQQALKLKPANELDLTSWLLMDPPIKTEIYYDAQDDTVKHTRLTDNTGATAVLREDPRDHNKVQLMLEDSRGRLITQGDTRGFAASIHGQSERVENFVILSDTLVCPTGKADINNNQTESVAREKLQQFAHDHPQLADALRAIELPVTLVGGLPVSFAKAVDTPTQYRACPENRSGIVLERLTEKSAPGH